MTEYVLDETSLDFLFLLREIIENLKIISRRAPEMSMTTLPKCWPYDEIGNMAAEDAEVYSEIFNCIKLGGGLRMQKRIKEGTTNDPKLS